MTEKYNGFTNHQTWNFDVWAMNRDEGLASLVVHQARTYDRETFAGWLMYNAEGIMGDDYCPREAHTIDFMSLVERYREMAEEEDYLEECEEDIRQDNKADLKMYIREVNQYLTAIYTVMYDQDHDSIKALIRAVEEPYGEAVKQCEGALFIVNGGLY